MYYVIKCEFFYLFFRFFNVVEKRVYLIKINRKEECLFCLFNLFINYLISK